MSAPEANETSLVEEFDSTMKDVLEAWPKRWEEFKAEQAVLIEQMIGMATEEAKKGHCRCTFSGRFETLMHQGDTRAVLQSHGFDPTGSTIHWHHKTIGRAEELRKIYISSLSNVDIQNLRKNVMEHIESFSTEPFRVYTRSKASKAALQEILKKYPILEFHSEYLGAPDGDYCFLSLKTKKEIFSRPE